MVTYAYKKDSSDCGRMTGWMGRIGSPKTGGREHS